MKKILISLLSIALVVSLTACGNKVDTSKSNTDIKTESTSVKSDKEIDKNVFQNIPLKANLAKIYSGKVSYFVQDGETAKFEFLNTVTGKTKSFQFSHYVVTYDVSQDENIWILSVPTKGNSDGTIYQFDKIGNELNSFSVKGQPMDMAINGEGTIFLAYENAINNKPNQIIALNSDGKEQNKWETGIYPMFVKDGDSNVYLSTFNEDVISVKSIEENGEKSELNFSNDVRSVLNTSPLVNGVGKYNFFAITNAGLFGYDKKEHAFDSLISVESLEHKGFLINQVFPLSENLICVEVTNDDFTERYFEIHNI